MTEYNTTPSGQPLGISHRPSPCRELFTRFKAQDKPAFIGYLPFGFPTHGTATRGLRHDGRERC